MKDDVLRCWEQAIPYLASHTSVVADRDDVLLAIKENKDDADETYLKLIFDVFEDFDKLFIEPHAATSPTMVKIGYTLLRMLISTSCNAGHASEYAGHEKHHRLLQSLRGKRSGMARRTNLKWARVEELRREISAKNPTLSAPQLAQKIRDRLRNEGSKKPLSVDWMARQIRKQSENGGKPGSVPRQ